MSKKNDTDNHIEIEKRKSMLTDCVLCPRNCHADRINGRWGRCHETAEIVVARAALHMWKNLAYPEMLAQEPYFFPAALWAAFFVRTII